MSKIDKMRKRYEIFTMSGPEGDEKSQAYYVIKVRHLNETQNSY